GPRHGHPIPAPVSFAAPPVTHRRSREPLARYGNPSSRLGQVRDRHPAVGECEHHVFIPRGLPMREVRMSVRRRIRPLRDERGIAAVFLAVTMVTLFAVGALAIDAGSVWTAR